MAGLISKELMERAIHPDLPANTFATISGDIVHLFEIIGETVVGPVKLSPQESAVFVTRCTSSKVETSPAS